MHWIFSLQEQHKITTKNQKQVTGLHKYHLGPTDFGVCWSVSRCHLKSAVDSGSLKRSCFSMTNIDSTIGRGVSVLGERRRMPLTHLKSLGLKLSEKIERDPEIPLTRRHDDGR